MRNKRLFIVIFIVLLSVAWASQGYSLMKKTHEAINKEVAQSTINGFSLDSYLKNNLGFNAGVDEQLNGIDAKGINVENEVFWWLGYGGIQEDIPPENAESPEGVVTFLANKGRANNHFHNPLETDWRNAGLNKTWYLSWSEFTAPYLTVLIALGTCNYTSFPLIVECSFTGESSVLWSQNPNQDPDQIVGGEWSWQDAREYFYMALTSGSQTDRENNFAKTFRAVGQLMHLVHDASVVMHTRNDIHILYSYEGFVEKIRNEESGTFDSWVANAISFDKSILELPQDPLAPIPIARIIDTDTYGGTNPEITTNKVCSITTSITCNTDSNCPVNEKCVSTIGMSEYANANFLSEDTMFTDGFDQNDPRYFPYPSRAGATLWFDGLRPYFKKESEGETVLHLATIGFAGVQRLRYFPQYYTYFPVDLDDKCYREYASLLIPRAVGYSAGLLDYFFRGKIEITPPAQVAYAVTDGSLTPYNYIDPNDNTYEHQQFTYIKANVRNTTPQEVDAQGNPLTYEDMQAGTIQAVAKYRIIPDYMPDLSNYPPDGTEMMGREFSYSLSAVKDITSLSSSEPTAFTFNFTDDPIPAGITDLSLYVIFKGTLGNETDIAVAVGMKDLMEPTHQVFWNLTDMYSLYYNLYTSDEIRADPSLADLVDFDDDGVLNEIDIGEPYIDPFEMTFRIGYMSGPPETTDFFYYSADAVIQAGRHIRLIALVDKPQDNYIALVEDNNIYPDTLYFYFAFPGVINQEEAGVWQPVTPLITFRYGFDTDGAESPIRHHFKKGFLGCLPAVTDPVTGKRVCPYPEEQAIPVELTPSPLGTVYFPQETLFRELTIDDLGITNSTGYLGVAQ